MGSCVSLPNTVIVPLPVPVEAEDIFEPDPVPTPKQSVDAMFDQFDLPETVTEYTLGCVFFLAITMILYILGCLIINNFLPASA